MNMWHKSFHQFIHLFIYSFIHLFIHLLVCSVAYSSHSIESDAFQLEWTNFNTESFWIRGHMHCEKCHVIRFDLLLAVHLFTRSLTRSFLQSFLYVFECIFLIIPSPPPRQSVLSFLCSFPRLFALGNIHLSSI